MSTPRSCRARLATYAAPRFVALALVAVASSCSSGNSASTALQVPHEFDLNVDPANAVKPIDPARTNVLAADQLRGVLEQDLAWHGITLSKVMQAARRGATDVQPWIDQRVSNYYYDITKRGFAQATVPQKIFSGEGYLPFGETADRRRSKYFWS